MDNAVFPNPMVFIPICPRSGSSVVAGTFELLGAFGGRTNGSTNINPKGQFENKQIRHAFIRFMQRAGINDGFSCPSKMLPLVESGSMPDLFGIKPQIARIFMRNGYTGGPAFFKDDHLMFHYAQIEARIPDCIWVIPRRSAESSAASMCSCNLEQDYGRALAQVREFYRCLDMLAAHCSNVYWIDTEQMIHGGRRDQLQAAIAAAGLAWDGAAVDNWIDPNLYDPTDIWRSIYEQ